MLESYSRPAHSDPQAIVESLAAHQATREFYYELQIRSEHASYCEWYHRVAEQHRQELVDMQQDINLLGYLSRRRL